MPLLSLDDLDDLKCGYPSTTVDSPCYFQYEIKRADNYQTWSDVFMLAVVCNFALTVVEASMISYEYYYCQMQGLSKFLKYNIQVIFFCIVNFYQNFEWMMHKEMHKGQKNESTRRISALIVLLIFNKFTYYMKQKK